MSRAIGSEKKNKSWKVVNLPGFGVVNALMWETDGEFFAHYLTTTRLVNAQCDLGLLPVAVWMGCDKGPIRVPKDFFVYGVLGPNLIKTARDIFNLGEDDEEKPPAPKVEIATPGQTQALTKPGANGKAGKILGQDRFKR